MAVCKICGKIYSWEDSMIDLMDHIIDEHADEYKEFQKEYSDDVPLDETLWGFYDGIE